jgi:hypothetical protein
MPVTLQINDERQMQFRARVSQTCCPLHCRQAETEDFRNMSAEGLLSIVHTLLETAENAFAAMAL